jgi:hypothetical protein
VCCASSSPFRKSSDFDSVEEKESEVEEEDAEREGDGEVTREAKRMMGFRWPLDLGIRLLFFDELEGESDAEEEEEEEEGDEADDEDEDEAEEV